MIESPPIQELKFPIGHFEFSPSNAHNKVKDWTSIIAEFPSKIVKISENLTETQLEWKYRPKGWNMRQVIHHCADSHMNGLIRTKLALTEDNPSIKPYPEALWANLSDSKAPIVTSIELLKGIHQKWVLVFEAMAEEDYQKTYFHPEDQKPYTLLEQLGLYAWHCDHHYAHLLQAIKFKGRFN